MLTASNAAGLLGPDVSLKILLSDRRGIYRPGQKLAGEVVLETREDLPICGKYYCYAMEFFPGRRLVVSLKYVL